MSDKTPEDLANAILEKGTFSFVDALKNRTYPTEDVKVYLDEAAAAPLLDINERAAQLDFKLSKIDPEKMDEEFAVALVKQREAVQDERIAVTKALEEQAFTITVQGIDPGKIDEFNQEALDAYPLEYTDYWTNPLTGVRSRDVLPNNDRDRFFNNLVWTAHVLKVVNPVGAVDNHPSIETVAVMRKMLPVASRIHVERAIEKVDMAVDWYEALADEVFLAKS